MSFLNKLKKGINIEIVKEKKEKKPKTEIKDEEWLESEGELAVDVYQENKNVIIEAPVAGVDVKDLDITVENDTIKIKGKREHLKKIRPKNYFLQECYWGPFSREIILPFEVSGSKANASIKQGILVIEVPKKRTQDKSTKIKIKQK